MFQAVLFDWDGTLADTRQAILLSFKRALNRVDVEVPDSSIVRRIGIGAENTFKEILKAVHKDFDDRLIRTLVKEKIQAEIDLSGGVALFPGAFKLLISLKGKSKIGLASMNNRAVIVHLIEKLQLSQTFDTVVTVEDVSHFKPHPEIFLKCASRLDVKPQKCLVVEDSIFGVEAAKTAGMSCLAVPTGAYNAEELRRMGPDMIIPSLADATKVLNFIFQ